jgi:rod shape determining protein RodA
MALQVQERTTIRKVDYNLIVVIAGMNVIGLFNLYSATHGPTSHNMGGLFWGQILYIIVGWIIYAAVTFMDYRIFLRFAYLLYGINVCFLFLVLIIGHASLGAQRWLDLGFFHYQPSETMKLVLVLVLARYFHTHVRPQGHTLRELVVPIVLVLIPTLFVVKQPDLGTGLLLVTTAMTMLLFVKIRTRVLVAAAIVFTIAMPIAWKFAFKEYQKNRVLTFLDPNRDPRGAGYNSIQSKIAVGSGRILGKGWRKGTQSQLEFLPERHTDFIFSVLSEEFGFVGSAFTLGLFITLFLMGVRIASQAKDKFGVLLVVGVMAILFWHMFINMGMTTGILPIVGIPLPLISYGGSSLLTTMLGLGMISSISLRRFLF